MSDRDRNDHQSMPYGSVSSGLRRQWGGRGGSTEIKERQKEREREREVERGSLWRKRGRGDKTDGEAG